MAVFDGIEGTRETIQRWYKERLNESIVREMMREDGKAQHVEPASATQAEGVNFPAGDGVAVGSQLPLVPLPEGIEIYEAEPITDRKSSFVGRACRITHPEQVGPTVTFPVLATYVSIGTAGVILPDVRSPDCPSGTSDHKCLEMRGGRRLTPGQRR